MKKTTTARKPVGGKKRPVMKVSKNPVRPTKYENQLDVENKLDSVGAFSFSVDYKGKAHGNMDIRRDTYPHNTDDKEWGSKVYHSKYTLHDIKKWEQSGKKKPLGEFVSGLLDPWSGK